MMRLLISTLLGLSLSLMSYAQQHWNTYTLASVTRLDDGDAKGMFDHIRMKTDAEMRCYYNEKSGEISLMTRKVIELEDLFRDLETHGWFLGNRGMLPNGEKCPPELGILAAQDRYLEVHPEMRTSDSPWIMLWEEQFNALPEGRKENMLARFEVILL